MTNSRTNASEHVAVGCGSKTSRRVWPLRTLAWRRTEIIHADLAAGVVSATFKQQRDKDSTQQQAADIAKLLSQSQSTLRDRAVSLSGRWEPPGLTDEVQALGDFQKDMMAASEAMAPAAQQLQQEKGRTPSPTSKRLSNSCCAPNPPYGRFRLRLERAAEVEAAAVAVAVMAAGAIVTPAGTDQRNLRRVGFAGLDEKILADAHGLALRDASDATPAPSKR